MPKLLPLACALMALAASLVALAHEHHGSRRERDLADRVERLSGELAALAAAPAAPPEALASDLDRIATRITALELASDRQPLLEQPATAVAQAEAPSEPSARAVKPGSGARAELEDLIERLLGPDYDLHGTDEEIQRFFELARSSGLLEEHVAELEAEVAEHPDDLVARMELADAYVAKVMTVANGPEQGVWGGKAERQWTEVAQRDPGNWAAHFALGNNYSYYPDVMGKTGEAIRYIERAREIQEGLAPSPEHVQTYLSLARLYVRDDRKAEARAVLESGLRFHPGDAKLLAELQRLDG